MATLAPLFEELFAVCRNGVLPNLKLVTAVANCHRAKVVHPGKEAIETWAPAFCGKLRMVSLHYRSLVICADTKGIVCYKKAS